MRFSTIVSVVTLVWGISPRQPSGKNIIRWLLKKRTNGSVRYCQYTSVETKAEAPAAQSKFRCQVCGYTVNADVNGARNILAAGHAVLACGEMVQSGRPLKQEPTEMIQATA
ncbi:zinc ribbon domain-containing protein [Shigella sonnei]|uniref:zinc ribbon domain-containing protein n=1 Tax=Shigella sonnei TaxID=624 RepID=UPI0030CF3744